MAAVVEIQVMVNSTDSAAKLGAVQAEISGLGTASTGAAAKVGAATQQIGEHFSKNVDSVRLMSEEFGLRMPRALESMTSRIPGFTTAISGMMGAFAGVAVAEIMVRIAEGIHKAYDEFISLNAVIDKYIEGMEKARQADIPNSRSFETTQQRLQQQTHVGALDAQTAQQNHDQGWQHIKGSFAFGPGALFDPNLYQGAREVYEGHGAEVKSTQADTERDALVLKQKEDTHELTTAQIDFNHAQDAALTGAQKNNAEAKKKVELAAETRRYQNDLDSFYGNEVGPGSGAAKQALADETAHAAAAAANTKLGQDSALAITKADDARVQAGMQGEALYFRKMQDDVRETTRELENQGKAAEIPARVREINEKYFEDMSERSVKAQNESGLSIRRANAGGLTGAARINSDWDTQISENNTKYANDPDRLHAENAAAATGANQKLLDLQVQFTDSMDGIGEQWVDKTLGGYQRIDAEAAKSAGDIEDKFNKVWGGANVDQNSAQYLAAKQAEQSALTAVQQGADAKRTELTQTNQAEDLRYEQQAADAERRVKEGGAMGWVAANKNAIAAIQAQEQANLAKLADDAKTRGLNDPEIEQRRIDIEREATAQIEQQQQEMSGKLSGLFESAFKDPIGTIKSTMEKLMFDLLAQWIMHFAAVKALFGSAAAGGGGGGGALAAGGGRFGGPGAAHNLMNIGSGGSSSDAGTSYRAAYSPMAPGATGSSGMVTGAGSAGGVNAALGAGMSGIKMLGGGSASTAASDAASASNVSFDENGNATDNATIPEQSMPGYNTPGVGGGSALATGMGIAGAAGAAYSAEQTTVGAFDKGSAGGVLSGTMGDAAAGAMIGSVIPGIGTAIGAGVGALVGFGAGLAGAVMGMGGRIAARDYYKQTLFPSIEADRLGQGGDPMSAISDVNRQSTAGMAYMTAHWGSGAASWVQANYLNKEVQFALSQISQHASGGEQYTERQAMQFDTGGYISDFGDMGTRGGHGFVHTQLGETVMNQSATAVHAPVLNAMNDGADPADVASMYLKGSGGGSSTSAAPSGGVQHIHVHAWDQSSVQRWLRGGGSRMIQKEQNNLAGQYAGDGVIG